MIDLSRAPFPITYRELWLPQAIGENARLPSSAYTARHLTLTGSRKGTTSDGVRGDGSATSNINCGAVNNAAVKYWVSLRFRPTGNWTLGSGDKYLWGKFLDATHYIRLKLDSATGNLIFEKLEVAAGFTLSIASPDGDGIWHAGTWYHALCSISDTAGARFKVNNANLQTNADLNPIPNGGDLCFLDYDDPGAGTGFVGVEADIFCGTDNLTTAEETDLYGGYPPADAVHEYLLDEGRGTTAYDRGSGANNGTLDTACTWAFGQVRQPVLSTDALNDRTTSLGGIIHSGNLTWAWVGKMKNNYTSISRDAHLFDIRRDDNNKFLVYYVTAANVFYYRAIGSGGAFLFAQFTWRPTIDEYAILIGTIDTPLGQIEIFRNGSSIASAGNLSPILPGADAEIAGRGGDGGLKGIDKPLLFAIMDGKFNRNQIIAYTRYMRDIFNLPIVV